MPIDVSIQFWFSLGVNAVASVLCSWVVAAIYFRRKSPAEKVADQIRLGLQRALIPILYPHFFDQEHSTVIYPEQPSSENKDIPRVEYARLTPRLLSLGTKVEVLMKILDLGYDLDVPGGVHVRDHRGNPIAVIGLGLGFCKFSFDIGDCHVPISPRITVELADIGEHRRGVPNRSVQSLPIVVEEEKCRE